MTTPLESLAVFETWLNPYEDYWIIAIMFIIVICLLLYAPKRLRINLVSLYIGLIFLNLVISLYLLQECQANQTLAENSD